MSFATYEAFNTAHVNMDEINRLMKLLPYELRSAVRTLIKSSNEEIETKLPANVNSIKYIARTAKQKAKEAVSSFDEAKTVLEEILAGATHTKYLSIKELEELKMKIEVQRKWEEHYKNLQSQIMEEKEELRTALDKSKTQFDEALDNLPSGWELVGLDFAEGLITVLDWGATAITFVAHPLDSLREHLSKESMDRQNDIPKVSMSPISTAVEKIQIPNCINNGLEYRASKKTNKKVDRHTATEFLVALTDLIMVENIIEEFIMNVFEEEIGSKNGKKLRKDFIDQSTKLEILTNNPKERVEALEEKMSLSQQLPTFYRNISDLAHKFRSWKNKNVEELQKDAQDLLESSRCFRTWAEQTAHYKSLTEPTPFTKPKETKRTLSSVAQSHMESAQLRVESYQAQLESAQDRYEKKIEIMLRNNENIQKTIRKLVRFDASKASMKQVLRY